MKLILSGTNRQGSRTRQIAGILHGMYAALGEPAEVLDLAELPLQDLSGQTYGRDSLSSALKTSIEKVNSAAGIVFVVPEYNGSYPGALKYFIDHWSYPKSFEARPVAFVGLGGTFGGLRPVEHLQQVMNYRNAYVFPQRVFLFNVWNQLKEGRIADEGSNRLLRAQTEGFTRFIAGLQSQKLDALSISTSN